MRRGGERRSEDLRDGALPLTGSAPDRHNVTDLFGDAFD